jgi:hypothetical protein
MAIHPGSRQVNDEAEILEQLAQDRRLGRHAFFFVTGEGEILPSGIEDASGYVIGEDGRVYAFWLGWDDQQKAPAFTEWEEVEPEPSWGESAEYRQARERVGLNPTSIYHDIGEPAIELVEIATGIVIAYERKKNQERKEYADLADLPLDALQGVSKADALAIEKALGVKTIRQLAENKYIRFAQAIILLAGGK